MTGSGSANGGRWDVVVIGAGQAGLAIAWHLAHQRRRFAAFLANRI